MVLIKLKKTRKRLFIEQLNSNYLFHKELELPL